MAVNKDLKNYKPNGKGRPPTDPAMRRIWDRAAQARKVVAQAAPKKAAPLTKKKAPPVKKPQAAAKKPAAAEEKRDIGSTFDPAEARARLAQPARTPKAPARVLSFPQAEQIPLDSAAQLLSGSSLHDIIALCRKEGVARLEVGTLKIELAAKPTANGPRAGKPVKTAPLAADSPAPVPLSVQASDPTALDDIEETQQLIDDPVGFEQQAIDGASRQGAVSAGLEDRRAEQDLRGG